MDYDDSYLNLPTCIRLWEPKKPDTTHTFIYSLCVSIFFNFLGNHNINISPCTLSQSSIFCEIHAVLQDFLIFFYPLTALFDGVWIYIPFSFSIFSRLSLKEEWT